MASDNFIGRKSGGRRGEAERAVIAGSLFINRYASARTIPAPPLPLPLLSVCVWHSGRACRTELLAARGVQAGKQGAGGRMDANIEGAIELWPGQAGPAAPGPAAHHYHSTNNTGPAGQVLGQDRAEQGRVQTRVARDRRGTGRSNLVTALVAPFDSHIKHIAVRGEGELTR